MDLLGYYLIGVFCCPLALALLFAWLNDPLRDKTECKHVVKVYNDQWAYCEKCGRDMPQIEGRVN